MRVYLEPDDRTRAFTRVVAALTRYAPPSVEIVADPRQADLVVAHVNGRRDRLQRKLRAFPRVAVIQYVLASSLRPDPADWLPCWQAAVAVWSYLDLAAACGGHAPFRFLHAPLGVEADVFVPGRWDLPPLYQIVTFGPHRLSEGVKECELAVQAHGGRLAHVGPRLSFGPAVSVFTDIRDRELAVLYQRTRYVCALRRDEGFELPAAEGLLCGSIPLLFDRPHYRQWYGDWGCYIPEGDRPSVVEAVRRVLATGPRPAVDRAQVAARFDWATIAPLFWEAVCP